MTSGYENRRFYRSGVELPVSLDFGQGNVKAAQTANLSLVGIYVTGIDPAPLDSECDAVLTPAPPLEPVSVHGRVMHRDGSGMGIEITGIEGASFETLRSLIVEHAEDAFGCETQIVANMSLIPPLY